MVRSKVDAKDDTMIDENTLSEPKACFLVSLTCKAERIPINFVDEGLKMLLGNHSELIVGRHRKGVLTKLTFYKKYNLLRCNEIEIQKRLTHLNGVLRDLQKKVLDLYDGTLFIIRKENNKLYLDIKKNAPLMDDATFNEFRRYLL